MTATTHKAIWTGIETAVEAGGSLTHSDTILDPNDRPQTHLDRLFSIEMQTVNTKKYRDQGAPGARVDVTATLRCAWRLNPKNHTIVQQRALDDEEAAIVAITQDVDAPLNLTRRRYTSTTRRVSRSREWLFHDIRFSIEFDLLLG